jgi:hypothetical protein
MYIDVKYKESDKLLLLVRGDLELLETGKDTSVFLQGMQAYIIFLNSLHSQHASLQTLITYHAWPMIYPLWWHSNQDPKESCGESITIFIPPVSSLNHDGRVQQLVEDCKTSRYSMEEYLKAKCAIDKEEEYRQRLLERHNTVSNKREDRKW